MIVFQPAKVGDLVKSRRWTDTKIHLVCHVARKPGVNLNEGNDWSYLLDTGVWVWGRHWIVIKEKT